MNLKRLDDKFMDFYKRVAKLSYDSVVKAPIGMIDTLMLVQYAKIDLINGLPENLVQRLNQSFNNYKPFNNTNLIKCIDRSREELRTYLLSEVEGNSLEVKEQMLDLVKSLSQETLFSKIIEFKKDYLTLRNHLLSEQEPVNQVIIKKTRRDSLSDYTLELTDNSRINLISSDEMIGEVNYVKSGRNITFSKLGKLKEKIIPDLKKRLEETLSNEMGLPKNKTRFYYT